MIEKNIAKSRPPDFLVGGGEMGELIRKYDWSKTSLGSADSWPQSLKTTISILLNSSYPMFVWWGKELVNIYNDAYSPILGAKHPAALGESASKVWSEIWIQGIAERAKTVFKGKPTFDESLLLIMERKGYQEECYFTFSYSPVRGDKGVVEGLFCACIEETKKIISERSLTTVKEINSPAEKTEESVYKHAAATLAKNNKDFPFAVLYKIENGRAVAVAQAGIHSGQEIFPGHINLKQALPLTKDFCRAFTLNSILVGENKETGKTLPKGFWEKQPSRFLYIPISGSGKKQPIALIWTALNPYRQFDDEYRQFMQLVADQLSLELNNVRAFEEERKRAEALAELDKAKTVFFSNISHEFRTPLTLMLGPLEELMQQKNLDQSQKEILLVTHRNALRMQKLVNNLLDFSRIEAGRINAFYEPVNLPAYTTDLASSFRSAIEKEGIQFVVDCPSLPNEVWVDKDMWEKIVLNLLSNAYKYTLKGEILVRLREESGLVKLTIADSGVGIPASELDKIFDRFHRVQNIKGRNFEGTGIGLSLVKELVKLHDGSITVESKEDQGTSFFISIPYINSRVNEKNQKTAPATAAIPPSSFVQEEFSLAVEGSEPSFKTITNKKYILVADDNYDMRNYIRRLLSGDYEIITVADGKAAWNAFQDRLPDLVIADIMMPEMDGFELLEAIKRSGEAVPVILLSARAGEEAINEGLQKGAEAYLVKPFSALQLKTMVLNRLLLKESQEKIEEKEKTFRNVLLRSPNIFLILKGENMIIEFANEPLLRSWSKGWDIVGKPLLEVLPELKEQAFPQMLDQVYKTGEAISGDEERAVIMKDGKAIDNYYNYVYQPIIDASGTVTGITVMATDITEQVMARKKIEESQRQLQLITDAVPILISYVDKERLYQFNNKAYENWFGHSRDDIRGRHMRDVLGEKAYENLKPHIDQVLTGQTVHFESLVSYQEGGERYILADYIPDFGMQKEVLGFYVVVTDITELKKAETALRISEEKYRNIFNTVDEGFSIVEVLFDDSGKPVDHIIHEANPSFEKNTGLVNPEGRKASELVPGLEQAWNELYATVIKTGEAQRVERYSGALQRWYDVLVSPMEPAGQNRVTIAFSDITERKKAETILKESEERFRSLAREAPIFVWLTDENLQTTFLNKTGLDYFNLDEAQSMETLSWKKYIHPGDLSRVLMTMNESIKNHMPYTLEMRLKNGVTGEYRWFLDKGSPRYNGESFTGFIGTSLDIHDRKEAEELLEQRVKERTEQLAEKNAELEEQKYFVETILASSRDLIAVFDTELRYISVNKEVEKLYSISAEEFKGKFIFDIYPQLKDTDTIRLLERCLQGEMVYQKELKSPVTGHSFQTYYVPLKNIEGKIYGAVVIGHDITDIIEVTDKIKAKNEELENSRSFLQRLMDSSVEYIAVLDRNLNFMTVNRRFEEGIGLPREQIIGRYLFDIHPRIENTDQHTGILKALNGETTYLDKRPSAANPNLYIDTYIIPFVQQNKVEAVIIMARDVTEIVRSELILEEKNTELENTINQLRRQELKDEQKNNFISMASHELKTPITSIKGYVQLLLSSLSKTGEEKPISSLLLRSSLLSVDKQITRLTRLISELLDLSKIESGTLELRRERFSLNELAIATVEDILYTNTRHNINLFHDDHFYLNADKDRIEQAIINFLTNAIKYSPGSDKIEVWIKKAGIDHVELSVKDYGIGIDKKYHDRIFERFYRVEGKEEQTYPGFGIGLFLTREIIERHQGTIKFESEKGKGSVFSFILPVSP